MVYTNTMDYQYISYHHEPLNPNSLADDNIWSVASDKAGYIWLVPVATGLDRLDPATGIFSHFPTTIMIPAVWDAIRME